jgi:hypothetical protein
VHEFTRFEKNIIHGAVFYHWWWLKAMVVHVSVGFEAVSYKDVILAACLLA